MNTLFVAVCIVFLLIIFLFLSRPWLEHILVWEPLSRAPEFRQLAFASSHADFQKIPIHDGWKNVIAYKGLDVPPEAMLVSPTMTCLVWTTTNPEYDRLLVVRLKVRELPWIIALKNGSVIRVSVGKKFGPHFTSNEIPPNERQALNCFLSNIHNRLIA